MRNNIIAIVIFVGFIATVFGIGYAVSRDTMPMHMGHVPNISTAGGMSVSRDGVDDALALQQVSTEPFSRVSAGYVSSKTPSLQLQGGSAGGGGTLYTASSQRLNAYGSGGSSGNSSNSSGTKQNNVSGGSGYSSIAAITHNKRDRNIRSGQLAETPITEIPNSYDEATLRAFGEGSDDDDDKPGGSGGHNDDPFATPIGEIPLALIALFSAVYASKRKNS